MKKIILYLPLFLVLNFSFSSCSTEETTESGETDNSEDNLNPIDPDPDEDAWRIIDIVGNWHLEYTFETNHDGIHVGTTRKIYSTEYNYVKYEFKEDNTFLETTAEGESSDDVEVTIRKGSYIAHYPERYSGKWLELRYENGDWDDSKFELNSDGTQIKIDRGTTTVICNCSENKYDYEDVFFLVE